MLALNGNHSPSENVPLPWHFRINCIYFTKTLALRSYKVSKFWTWILGCEKSKNIHPPPRQMLSTYSSFLTRQLIRWKVNSLALIKHYALKSMASGYTSINLRVLDLDINGRCVSATRPSRCVRGKIRGAHRLGDWVDSRSGVEGLEKRWNLS
jgi:hypothetical protein